MCFREVKETEQDNLAPRYSSGANNEKPVKANKRSRGDRLANFYKTGGNAGATGAAGAINPGMT